MKIEYLQANWICYSQDDWLRKMVIGTCLNVCSGMSKIGDERIDIAEKTNRTLEGDLFKLNYVPRSFDTVICDPPYSYYNRFKWALKLSDIANSRLILASGLLSPRLPKRNWKRELWYDNSHRSPTGGRRIMLKLWWVFNRLNYPLKA